MMGSWNPQLVEAVVGAVMNTGVDAGMQMAPKRKKNEVILTKQVLG